MHPRLLALPLAALTVVSPRPLSAQATSASAAPAGGAREAAEQVHREILAGRLDVAAQRLAAARAALAAPTPADAARLQLSEAEIVYYRAFLVGPPYDAAIARLRAALAAAESAGESGLVADAQDTLALALYSRDFGASAHAEARALLDAALATRRALADHRGVAESLFHLGLTSEYRDQPTAADLERARELYTAALAEATAHGHLYEASYAERHLAALADGRGDLPAARAGFERSLALRRQAGATLVVAPALTALADVVARQGDVTRARELYAEAIEIARRIGAPRFEQGAEEGLKELAGR